MDLSLFSQMKLMWEIILMDKNISKVMKLEEACFKDQITSYFFNFKVVFWSFNEISQMKWMQVTLSKDLEWLLRYWTSESLVFKHTCLWTPLTMNTFIQSSYNLKERRYYVILSDEMNASDKIKGLERKSRYGTSESSVFQYIWFYTL